MSEAVALLAEARRFMDEKTFMLSMDEAEQRDFWAMRDSLRAFDAERAAEASSGEGVMALLNRVYNELGRCEYKRKDVKDFSEWGKRAHAVLPNPNSEWFKKPNVTRVTMLEVLDKLWPDFDMMWDISKPTLMDLAYILLLLSVAAWCCR